MIIDFSKIAALIPTDGSLTLLMTKKDEKISLCYTTKFKGKENNENFKPITLRGTAEELSELFAQDVPEIAQLQEKLYEQTKASTVIAKTKQNLTKAITKAAPKTDSKTTGEEKKPDQKTLPPKKEPPVPPPMVDLFSSLKNPAETKTSEAPPPAQEENEAPETEEVGGE